MSDAPLILGVSGLRGIVGESLTPEIAARFAAAFGAWLRDRLGGRDAVVAVSADGRRGYASIYHAAIAGLADRGHRVLPMGVATTPTTGVAVDAWGCDGALVCTASHNPQAWNGLKALLAGPGGSSAPPAAHAETLIQRFNRGPDAWTDDAAGGGTVEPEQNTAPALHADRVAAALADRVEAGRLRIVVDSVNASGAGVTHRLADRLGVRCVQLHGSGSGVFPHPPEPTMENLSGAAGLCDAVTGLAAHAGFAQDPDADRLAIVDEHGRYIGEEYTLALAAESVLSRLGADAAEAVLVANLSTSRLIDDVAARHGARVVRTPVGEANVVERMKQLAAEGHRVVLGGEGNGGVIWPEITSVRDSLSAMGLLLALLSETAMTVGALVDGINACGPGGARQANVKRKTPRPRKQDAKPALEALADRYAGERIDRQDGVRIDFTGARDGAWVHVRPSNTEPILRLICEAPHATTAGAILDEIAGLVDAG